MFCLVLIKSLPINCLLTSGVFSSVANGNDFTSTHHHGDPHGGAGGGRLAVDAVCGGDDELVEAARLVVQGAGREDLTARRDGEGAGVRPQQLVGHAADGVGVLRLSQGGRCTVREDTVTLKH